MPVPAADRRRHVPNFERMAFFFVVVLAITNGKVPSGRIQDGHWEDPVGSHWARRILEAYLSKAYLERVDE